MFRVPVLLVVLLAAFSAHSEPSATMKSVAAASDEATYESADGRFSFRYPRGWSLAENREGGMFSHLSSFALGSRCCAMSEGDVKIDFAVLDVNEARQLGLTYARRCAGSPYESSVSCRTPVVNGARWGWVYTRGTDGGTRGLYAIFEGSDRVVAAIGIVAEGPSATRGVSEFERVFRTFRVG